MSVVGNSTPIPERKCIDTVAVSSEIFCNTRQLSNIYDPFGTFPTTTLAEIKTHNLYFSLPFSLSCAVARPNFFSRLPNNSIAFYFFTPERVLKFQTCFWLQLNINRHISSRGWVKNTERNEFSPHVMTVWDWKPYFSIFVNYYFPSSTDMF